VIRVDVPPVQGAWVQFPTLQVDCWQLMFVQFVVLPGPTIGPGGRGIAGDGSNPHPPTQTAATSTTTFIVNQRINEPPTTVFFSLVNGNEVPSSKKIADRKFDARRTNQL
jgi:hypothetical protein